MRIVHVSDCYPPRLGGIEMQVSGLATRQASAGHDVHVITATRAPDARPGVERLDGVTVHRVVARMPFDLPVHPRVVSHVRGLLTGACARADVVHVQGGVVSPFAYPAALVAADLGLATLVTVHGVWGPLATPVAAFADRLVKWSDRGIVMSAVSDAAAAPMREMAGLVYILPNGIDVEAWRVVHVPGSPRVTRALAVMRLAPRKRGGALVDIVAAAQQRVGDGRRIAFTIVGDGPGRSYLESRAGRAGAIIEFVGRRTRAEVRDMLAASDVFLAPATRESFGIAALEARTAGVPVIARVDTGVTSFVTHGREGLLVDSDDSFVDALVTLCVDESLRERIAHHNVSTRPEQDWPHVVETAEKLYRIAARGDARDGSRRVRGS